MKTATIQLGKPYSPFISHEMMKRSGDFDYVATDEPLIDFDISLPTQIPQNSPAPLVALGLTGLATGIFLCFGVILGMLNEPIQNDDKLHRPPAKVKEQPPQHPAMHAR